MKPNIALVVGCGEKKNDEEMPAYLLYKHPRFRVLYKEKGDCDMWILSGKHALIRAEKVISPYSEYLTEEKIERFAKKAAENLSEYDYVIYYRGGTGRNYLKCISRACKIAQKPLIIFGFAIMGGIHDVSPIVKKIVENKVNMIEREIEHAKLHARA